MIEADAQDILEITALAKLGRELSEQDEYEAALRIADECLERIKAHKIKFPNRAEYADRLIPPINNIKAGLERLVGNNTLN